MSLVLDREGLSSQAVNIMIKYFKTYKNGSMTPSDSGDIYPTEVLEMLSTVVVNAIKSHVSAFSDRTILLEVTDCLFCLNLYYVEDIFIICDDNMVIVLMIMRQIHSA